MNLENIIKGIFTTILGIAIMTGASYGWYVDHLSDWQAGGFGTIGFALLFMRDQIPQWIGKFAGAAIEKFTGKKDEPKQ